MPDIDILANSADETLIPAAMAGHRVSFVDGESADLRPLRRREI
jgi:hypothetical protein